VKNGVCVSCFLRKGPHPGAKGGRRIPGTAIERKTVLKQTEEGKKATLGGKKVG